MEKYSLMVESKTAEMELLKYIHFALPLLPQSAVKKALKNRDIRLNSQRINENQTVKLGDEIIIFTEQKQKDIPIVFEDENIIVFNKPNRISVDSDNGFEYTLTSYADSYFNGAVPCHRLDNQTFGLIVFAKHEKAKNLIEQAFKKRKVYKEYECLTAANVLKAESIERAYLYKDEKRARVYISDTEKLNYKTIITEWHLIEKGDISRLRVILHTGRTHQIRAHLAHLNMPVLGDNIYGDFKKNKEFNYTNKLALCSCKLSIRADGELAYLKDIMFEIKAPF